VLFPQAKAAVEKGEAEKKNGSKDENGSTDDDDSEERGTEEEEEEEFFHDWSLDLGVDPRPWTGFRAQADDSEDELDTDGEDEEGDEVNTPRSTLEPLCLSALSTCPPLDPLALSSEPAPL